MFYIVRNLARMWGLRVIVVSLYIGLSTSTEGPLKIVYVETFSSVTLDCPSTSVGMTRSWFSGVHNMLTYTDPYRATSQRLLFKQLPAGKPKNMTPSDMTLVENGFQLKIEPVKSKHTEFYTCITELAEDIMFDIFRLEVYGGSPNVTVFHVIEGGDITLECLSTQSGVDRGWYRGTRQDDTTSVIYTETASGAVFREPAIGADFSIDRSTFALTYMNIQLADRGFFKCITKSPDAKLSPTIFINVYSEAKVMLVPEFDNITLSSRIPAIGISMVYWKHGQYGVLYVTHSQNRTGSGSSGNRIGMMLLGDTLDLRLSAVYIEDDTFITFIGTGFVNTIVIYRLQVYTTPYLLGSTVVLFNETDTVTMKCTIHRIYPAILSSELQMIWGDSVNQSTGLLNSDGSWSSNVAITKTLTAEDDKSIVNCTVWPKRGQRLTRYHPITVIHEKTGSIVTETVTLRGTTYRPITKGPLMTRRTGQGTTGRSITSAPTASHSTQQPTPALSDSDDMNLTAIIGGGVAVVVLLLIITIIVVVCLRKTTKKHTSDRSANSTQNEYTNPAFHESIDRKNSLYD